MDFREYRRRLPHWRDEDRAYFVTWRVRKGVESLNEIERSIVLDALKYFHQSRYELYGCVVMDDHIHAVLRPLDTWKLEDILHSWKSYTSNAILRHRGSSGPLWQEEYFDRIVRDESELVEKLNYMQNNPYKRWPGLDEYVWMWLGEGWESENP